MAFLSKRHSKYLYSEPIACIQRQAFDPINAFIYRALSAIEFYNIKSGIGKGRYFNIGEIENAIKWLPSSVKEELLFLDQVKFYMQNKIFILFN